MQPIRRHFLRFCLATLILLFVSPLCAADAASSWSFGVIPDTQWAAKMDAPFHGVAIHIIDAINDEFVRQKVDFVIQVGDMVETPSVAAFQTRAAHNKSLTEAGIKFYPVRGNHDAGSPTRTIEWFKEAFPNLPGTPGCGGNSPDLPGAAGMTYSFTHKGGKFILLDLFSLVDDGTKGCKAYSVGDYLPWIESELKKEDHRFAFVFAHKNLQGQGNKDNIFGNDSDANLDVQNAFLACLQRNGVRYFFAGHDHMYHHSLIKSPDGQSEVQQILCGSAAHKFFVPSLPFPERNRPIAQDLNRVGFCIVRVKDNRVDVEYYSTEPFGTDSKTPQWELRDSFGYTLGGQEFGKPTEKPKHVVHTRVNVAHRGASSVAPENTLASYRTAIEFGANGGECDVYRSADGILFLSHDRTPKRTMGGDEQNLTQMTFEQIRQFDAGSWKGEKFKGEKVPMLAEYLKLLKDTKCHPVIEIKQSGIEADVLECIRCYEMIDVSTIIAFDAGVVKEIRRLEPKIAVAWLYGEDLKDKGTAEENAERLADFLLQRCRELDITVLDLNYGLLSPKLIKSLNEVGVHVWAWTVNDEAAMRRFLDWGVVSITTDKPELLSRILEERKSKETLSVQQQN